MENFGVKIFQNWEKIPSLGQKKFHQFLKKYFFIGETCEGTNRSKIIFLVTYFIPNKEFLKWLQEKRYTCVNIVKKLPMKIKNAVTFDNSFRRETINWQAIPKIFLRK